MSLIRLNTHPSRNQLIQFGVAWVIFFLLTAMLAAWRSAPFSPWIIVTLAIIPPLIGCIFPIVLRILYIFLSVITFPIGFLLSQLITAALYYLVLTSTGFIVRCVKSNFFPKRPDASLPSYWYKRTRTRAADDYFKLY